MSAEVEMLIDEAHSVVELTGFAQRFVECIDGAFVDVESIAKIRATLPSEDQVGSVLYTERGRYLGTVAKAPAEVLALIGAELL